MKHNINNILQIIQDGLDREEKRLDWLKNWTIISEAFQKPVAIIHQEWVKLGIELVQSWIENNISLASDKNAN